MKIRVVESQKEFLQLENDWNNLAKDLMIINRFNWMYSWWDNFKEGRELKILVAEKNNKVVGIAPLCIENRKALKFINTGKLCFLGGIISDYLDFLIKQDEDRENIFISLLNYALNDLSYDYLLLGQIYSGYPNFDLWEKYSSLLNIKFKKHNPCNRTNFTKFKSYQDFYNSLGKSFKQNMRYVQNRAIKRGVDFKYVFKRDITRKEMDIIADINIKRQKFLYNKGDHKRFSYFINHQSKDFITEHFTNDKNDSKMLVYLEDNDKIVSYMLLFLDSDTLFYWNTGFDPEYEVYSPTKLLINEAIRYGFENNYKYYDFMRGNDTYKLHWANEEFSVYDLSEVKSLKAKIISLYREITPLDLLKNIKFKSKELRNTETAIYDTQ